MRRLCALPAQRRTANQNCLNPAHHWKIPFLVSLCLCCDGALALSIALALCVPDGQSRFLLCAARGAARGSPPSQRGPAPPQAPPGGRPAPPAPCQGAPFPWRPPAAAAPHCTHGGGIGPCCSSLHLGPFFSKSEEGLKGSVFQPFPSALLCGGQSSPLKVALARP